MPGGTFTLKYGGVTLEVGTVTTINESMQKSCTVVPLVSMDVDDTFAVESRSSKTINISFKRNDSDWSQGNAEWIQDMCEAVNRWQCRTDGFTAKYVADSDNPYIAPFEFNGYVKSFIYRYASGSPEVIEGSIEFHVGTMYSGSQPRTSVSRSQGQFSVEMSTADGGTSYPLLGNNLGINCVESYSLCGGPESPFEYVTMVIPRNRLTELAPVLTAENGIVAGRNALIIRAVGESDMTVTKCKLNNNKYTVTAYCNADKLRGCTLSAEFTGTPSQVITTMLDGRNGVSFSGESLIMSFDPNMDNTTVTFAAGRNVWYILQVCAILLRCRIFFAQNKAYVIDYTRQGDYSGLDTVESTINLYSVGSDDSMVAGTVSLGDEGIDTVVNKLELKAKVSVLNQDGSPKYDPVADVDISALPEGAEIVGDYVVYNEIATHTVEDTEGSIAMFGERTLNINVPDLTQLKPISVEVETPNPEDPEGEPIIENVPVQDGTTQAQQFGENFIEYRSEPQQSIEFTVKEMHKVSNSPVWYAEYMPAARATTIRDVADDVVITNQSDLVNDVKPQKLCLSTYEMHFPQGTTTYTWGVMASIDLSSSTSQIMTSIDNS